jgi:hypothetical protein
LVGDSQGNIGTGIHFGVLDLEVYLDVDIDESKIINEGIGGVFSISDGTGVLHLV